MEMPGWRWMLLVLLLGGHRLETSGIAVLDGCFRDGKRQAAPDLTCFGLVLAPAAGSLASTSTGFGSPNCLARRSTSRSNSSSGDQRSIGLPGLDGWED